MGEPSPVRQRFEVAEVAARGAVFGFLAWVIAAAVAAGRWENLVLLAVTFALYLAAFWAISAAIRAWVRFLHRRWPGRYPDPARMLDPFRRTSVRWQWVILTILALLGVIRDVAEAGGSLAASLAVLDFTMAGLVTWGLLGGGGGPGRLALRGALAGAAGSAAVTITYLALTGGDVGDIAPPVILRWALYGLGAGAGLALLRGRPAAGLGLGLVPAILLAGWLTRGSEAPFVWSQQGFLAAGWAVVLGANRFAAAALRDALRRGAPGAASAGG